MLYVSLVALLLAVAHSAGNWVEDEFLGNAAVFVPGVCSQLLASLDIAGALGPKSSVKYTCVGTTSVSKQLYKDGACTTTNGTATTITDTTKFKCDGDLSYGSVVVWYNECGGNFNLLTLNVPTGACGPVPVVGGNGLVTCDATSAEIKLYGAADNTCSAATPDSTFSFDVASNNCVDLPVDGISGVKAAASSCFSAGSDLMNPSSGGGGGNGGTNQVVQTGTATEGTPEAELPNSGTYFFTLEADVAVSTALISVLPTEWQPYSQLICNFPICAGVFKEMVGGTFADDNELFIEISNGVCTQAEISFHVEVKASAAAAQAAVSWASSVATIASRYATRFGVTLGDIYEGVFDDHVTVSNLVYSCASAETWCTQSAASHAEVMVGLAAGVVAAAHL